MTPRQYEIWKAKPAGFERAHWFVIVSGAERCASEKVGAVNGLACFLLRGDPSKTDVRLNGADGFEHATVCQCDYFFPLAKSELKEKLGVVSYERQNAIKARIREILRLN
jgi:hypothetical protein